MNKVYTVWFLNGAIDSFPGFLTLNDGVISFTAVEAGTLSKNAFSKLGDIFEKENIYDDLIEEKRVPLFSLDKSDFPNIKTPWYYFKGGVKFSYKGEQFSFSFTQPQNTKLNVTRAATGVHADLGGVLTTAKGIKEARAFHKIFSAFIEDNS